MESTPSKALAAPHRLLYRGSLSLPDSYLLLDGLSFTVDTAQSHGSPALLNNTLALTLESLRGLPLHLIGTVRVKDVWIEPPPADISIDIHPDSTSTRIYFENLFCINPITSKDRRSEYGIRVSLTDNDDPETPDLIIYAELRPSPPSSSACAPTSSPSPATASTSHSPPHTLHLLAARILPGPPPLPSFRLPRPDDPTPRRPPLAFGGAGAGAGAKRKRESVKFDLSAAQAAGEGGASKRARDAKGKGPAIVTGLLGMDAKALGKHARVGVGKGREGDVFKVPSVPVSRTVSEADVFGRGAGSGKGKEKERAKARDGEKEEQKGEGEGVERENKNVVKRAVINALAREGIEKTHGEFKDFYSPMYHGVCLALRRRMTTGPLDGSLVEHFVDAHLQMYLKDAPE
ncbi:hypothetical protein GSI_04858 [Ganoderma sinense ZZ0214-1]|uniref:Sld7 C-terminal domain-containing protein n=1 Tax=Ganoderma sinense ZZ0214-1 TaxID=1077348 RepID=A0A2G8SG61_9APHY|nr:hypothetical protein GSI_04858 [Ganoderma sinense ZZ0214-1]